MSENLKKLNDLHETMKQSQDLMKTTTMLIESEIRNEQMNQEHKELKTLVEKLFQSMDENTTSLWTDDLGCTMECVVLEDSDGVKVDENDNPIFPTTGFAIVHLMDKITKEHLNK